MTPRRKALKALARLLHTGRAEDSAVRLPSRLSEWQDVIGLANEHLVAPALWAALGPAQASAPPEVRRYLALLYRLNRRRNRAIHRQAVELIGALNDAHVEPLLLKGVLSLVAGDPLDPASRMMADIDICVRRKEATAAVAVLERLGYTVRHRYPEGHHAYGEFARDGDAASVDLHFELIDQPYLLPAEEVWRRSRRAEIADGVFCCLPGPTDRVFHHLLHAQLHHLGGFYRGTIRLAQLYEFALLARHLAGMVDWTLIRDRMRQHRLTTPLYSYVGASGVLFGTPWPFSVPATREAKIHMRRCLAAVEFPVLGWLGIPWGNFRSAFAWHRMASLYRGNGVRPALWWIHHIQRVLQRHPISFPLQRLFRH